MGLTEIAALPRERIAHRVLIFRTEVARVHFICAPRLVQDGLPQLLPLMDVTAVRVEVCCGKSFHLGRRAPLLTRACSGEKKRRDQRPSSVSGAPLLLAMASRH